MDGLHVTLQKKNRPNGKNIIKFSGCYHIVVTAKKDKPIMRFVWIINACKEMDSKDLNRIFLPTWLPGCYSLNILFIIKNDINSNNCKLRNFITYCNKVMMALAAKVNVQQCSGHHFQYDRNVPKISRTQVCNKQWLSSKGFLWDSAFVLKTSTVNLSSSPLPFLGSDSVLKNRRTNVLSRDVSSPSFMVELLDAWDDEYNGIIINPDSLPLSANAFSSALKTSLSIWKLKGKKGIWLKILLEQADLVPIAIQEGFNYHHAEPGYVMLTHWIPDDPCMLPGSPSHQIGVGGFIMNDRREVLVVKEKCPSGCSGVWKIPTGYINKSEDIFSGAIREIKEETGVDTVFLKMVAFRHAHLMAFDKSDLLFVCMLKPLSYEITIDDKEIEAAKWMPLDEFMGQPFYQEDDLSQRVIDLCIAAHEDHYNGFSAHQLTSKLDGKLSYLYYDSYSQF